MKMTRKPKIQQTGKPRDEICEIILKFFYGIHKKARSLKSARLKISKVKEGLKKCGLNNQEIINNLDYLIQTGWILKEIESSQIRTKRGIITGASEYYKASDKTIDHFEGASKFQRIHPTTGINITNIQGVTVVGDQNIVNAQYSDLYSNLALLSEEVRKSNKFSDEQKLNYVAEIETIKSQLSKTDPDKNIISRAWDKLKMLSEVEGIASFIERIASLIVRLLL